MSPDTNLPSKTEGARNAHTPRVVGGVLLLVLAGIAGAFLLPLGEWVDSLTNWGAKAGWSGALLVGLLFVPICLFMLPASTLLAYGMAVAFGLWPSFLGIMVGANLGAMACFLAGRTLARGFVERQKETRPLLAALDSVLDESSFGMIVLVRLSPLLPFALVGYALGATRSSSWRHALATTIAVAPQTLLTCYIGSTVGDIARGSAEHERGPLEYTMLGLGILAAFVVIGVISKRTKAALEAHLPGPKAPDSAA
jgi:uncharacterized membrane protein YdjX (TVP38/TMEM64 family)